MILQNLLVVWLWLVAFGASCTEGEGQRRCQERRLYHYLRKRTRFDHDFDVSLPPDWHLGSHSKHLLPGALVRITRVGHYHGLTSRLLDRRIGIATVAELLAMVVIRSGGDRVAIILDAVTSLIQYRTVDWEGCSCHVCKIHLVCSLGR
jgi:hypothetical protein